MEEDEARRAAHPSWGAASAEESAGILWVGGGVIDVGVRYADQRARGVIVPDFLSYRYCTFPTLVFLDHASSVSILTSLYLSAYISVCSLRSYLA